MLKASQYDPRVKKSKVKPHQRQPALDLNTSSVSMACSSSSDLSMTTSQHESELPQTISEYTKVQRLKLQRSEVPLRPYIGKKSGSPMQQSAITSSPTVNSSDCSGPPEAKTDTLVTKKPGASAVCHKSTKRQAPSTQAPGCLTKEQVEKQRKTQLYLQARG